jgi:putative solute:sodium symporter small subunit
MAFPDMTIDNDTDSKPTRYWRDTRRLTLWLAGAWLSVTFCVVFFARDLYGFKLFGWPVSFYMAAQGILLVYVAIVGIYAWQMRRLDKTEKRRATHEQ